jgi:hypothetical protein
MPNASFQYSTLDPDEFEIQTGDTVDAAWRRVARDFGADPGRPASFRAGGAIISGTATPQPGQVITVTVNHDQKGAIS